MEPIFGKFGRLLFGNVVYYAGAYVIDYGDRLSTGILTANQAVKIKWTCKTAKEEKRLLIKFIIVNWITDCIERFRVFIIKKFGR